MAGDMNVLQRIVVWFAERVGLATVRAVDPGRPNDGMVEHFLSGTTLDRRWPELRNSFADSRTAWRENPMIRRMVGLTTSYVVGSGVQVSSDKPSLDRFVDEFWNHRMNRMDLRLSEWSNELARAGEIFPVLFTNASSGMSYVRLIPADFIEEIDYDPNDYERELRYREKTGPGEEEKWWLSPLHPRANEPNDKGEYPPVMLHYAINRTVGAIRGESDLWPILRWAKRYEMWLQDRASLNAAMRSFYWVVYAARHLQSQLVSKYSSPPPTGSVIVAEEGGERWEPITPNLGARDAKEDGRAMRWMIAAGGLGTALTDFGEGEESGLTRSANGNEQRRRFLLQRQRYFTFLIADLVVQAFNRRNGVRVDTDSGRSYGDADIGDVIVKAPDISVEDNGSLAAASTSLMDGLTKLQKTVGDTPEFRQFALRMFVKFVGESISEKEFDAILKGEPLDDAVAAVEANAKVQAKYAPDPGVAKGNTKDDKPK